MFWQCKKTNKTVTIKLKNSKRKKIKLRIQSQLLITRMVKVVLVNTFRLFRCQTTIERILQHAQ